MNISLKAYLKHQLRFAIMFALIYGAAIYGYHRGILSLTQQGLEPRFVVEAVYHVFYILGAVLTGGAFLRIFCVFLRYKGNLFFRILASLILLVYTLAGFAAVVAGYGAWILTARTDRSLPDGNLIVAAASGDEDTYYYAEPVMAIARRRFDWTHERIAQSLSTIYGRTFTADESDPDNTFYVTEEYPTLQTRVYGIGTTAYDYLETDFTQLLTQQSLIDAWEDYFKNGEDFISFNWGTSAEPRTIGALCVYYTRRMEQAQDIAAYVKDQIENTDNWESYDGTLFVVVKMTSDEDADHYCTMTFGRDNETYADPAAVLSALEECYGDVDEEKGKAIADSPAGDSQISDEEAQTSDTTTAEQAEGQDSEGTENAADPRYEGLSQQETWILQGYDKIYDDYFVEWNYSFIQDSDAEERSRIILFENREYLYYLQYKGDSNDGTSGKYGFYEVKKEADGTWSSRNVTQLDTYYYIYDAQETRVAGAAE